MRFCNECSLKEIIPTAKGERPADLVLKGGHVFNVFTRSWEEADVAIKGNKIVGVGEYSGEEEIDVSGKYLTPGFIDAHVHLESSMLSPRELVKILLLNGVTTVVADPHEITNVMGTNGIEFFLRETEEMPFSVNVMIPSSVPATTLETSGACLDAFATEAAGRMNSRVLGLAEMMNFPGVLNSDDEVLAKLKAFEDRVIDGHAPGLTGRDLNAYVAGGVMTEHECVTPEEAMEKISRGMYVFLREGSAAHNLVDLLPIVNDVTCSRCCLCTDDRHADDLIMQGSINYLIEIGVTRGVKPEQLITMATLNTSQCYGLARTGAIAPGYMADINIFDNLVNFQPEYVLKSGIVIVKNRRLQWESTTLLGQPELSMHMPELTLDKLRVEAPEDAEGRKIHVIGIEKEQLLTKDLHMTPKIEDGLVVSDVEQDVLKFAVCERHHNTGNVGIGFVHGFSLRKGAIASTVGHDSHNLLLVGTNDADMVLAANRVRAAGGGLAVVADGEVKSLVSLPIAGLMSDRKASVVNSQLKDLHMRASELGIHEDYNAFMTLSFLALPVIPEIRLTDKGIVDVKKFEIIDLFI